MRKYKTVIEIVCEAEDHNEAMDVAGEYLRGALSSGVSMRCQTRPLSGGSRFMLTGFMALGLIGAGFLSTNLAILKPHQAQNQLGFNACQAPLRTTITGPAETRFKESWQDKGLSGALKRIKK